jgi:uncharacterized protein YoxC
VELSGIAATFLVIGYFVFAGITAAALAGFAVGLRALNAKIEAMSAKVDPLLSKADEVLGVASDKIVAIGNKTEGLLAQGEETAESVHQKVDKTATAVQRTIHAPIINLNSLAAGVSRGVETFGRLQRQPQAVVTTIDGVDLDSRTTSTH